MFMGAFLTALVTGGLRRQRLLGASATAMITPAPSCDRDGYGVALVTALVIGGFCDRDDYWWSFLRPRG